MTELSADVLRWIEGSVGPGAHVVAVDELPPSSTQKHRIELSDAAGSIQVVVLRRYHDAERLASDFAYVPANEAEALRVLRPTHVPVPSPVGLDLDAAVCDVPAILETWIPGRSSFVPLDGVDLDRFLRRPAKILVGVHEVEVRGVDLPPYRPYAERANPRSWHGPRSDGCGSGPSRSSTGNRHPGP